MHVRLIVVYLGLKIIRKVGSLKVFEVQTAANFGVLWWNRLALV